MQVGDRVTFLRKGLRDEKLTLWGKVINITGDIATIAMPWGWAFEPVEKLKHDSMETAHEKQEKRRAKISCRRQTTGATLHGGISGNHLCPC